MGTRIYEKTDKGREEIATRKHQLPMRLRSVLVMIDGRQSLSTLLAHLAKLGLNQVSIDELTAQEFIRVIPGTEPVVVPAVALVARLPTAVRRMQKLREANSQLNTLQLIELEQAAADVVSAVAAVQTSPAEPAASTSTVVDSPPAISDAQRFESVHKFYNETIRGNLGLRGFGLQLKVEKAGNLDDLRALRAPYLEAVKKSRGNEMAQALDVRLSSLLAAESVA